jgi:hypothetical protein
LLLLVLAVGPLQAQTVFACAMMDTVMHDECCCDDHKTDDDCAVSKCDSLESSEVPCCERSVEVSVDQEAGQHAPLVKPPDIRSDVDPPPGLVTSFDALFPPQPFLAPRDFHFPTVAAQSGSDTYLVTQRLRI